VPAQTTTPDWVVQGNPFLLHAVADNFDLRYEIFPRSEENLFLGVFYKNIQNPIEQELLDYKRGIFKFTNVNAPTAAHNYGFELAFTKYWGKFGVTGNYTYTHSAVTTSKHNFQDSLVADTRPLQGQTDHIVNVSLLYKDVKHGFFGQISYEYQGTTLAQVSIYYQSDYYQHPMNSLALSLEKDIHNHFTVFGKFNNLLNTPTTEYVQKTLLVAKDIYKASYSIGIRYAR
jgi:outer membrane receptor protein involved in Fe transport